MTYKHLKHFPLFLLIAMSMQQACAQEKQKPNAENASAQHCRSQGEYYEKKKTKKIEEHWENLQKAQDFYLCAEKLGDTYAGYKAAGLSEAGVAKTLPPEEEIRLFTNSANAGNHLAANVLYGIACGNVHQQCANPVEAKKWLLIVAKSDEPYAYNLLGGHYELGYEGHVDLNKAAACYKRAAEKGDEMGINNLKKLAEKSPKLSPTTCP